MNSVALPTPSAQKDEELIERALVATTACIAEHGLHKLSMDHIAAQSGISRATLYRRFGNRDGILSALTHQQAIPYVESTLRRTASAESLAESIEIGTVCAITELPQYPILNIVFNDDSVEQGLRLSRPVYQHVVHTTLIPRLQAAQEKGELRTGLAIEEVADWLLRVFLQLAKESPWKEDALLRRIRQFILPILIPDDQLNGVSRSAAIADVKPDRLDKLEARVDSIYQLLMQKYQHDESI